MKKKSATFLGIKYLKTQKKWTIYRALLDASAIFNTADSRF